MSKMELSDTYVRENDSRITHREFLLQGVEKLTLLDDTFMNVALKDISACQHVIRILMNDPTIKIIKVRTQYRFSRLISRDTILDVLAEDSRGRIYNLEVQRERTSDDARRTRLYSAMVDGECLEKGQDYDKMPEVYVIYISKTDLWNTGNTEDPVCKYLHGLDREYDDGQHIIYVNAAVDDGSPKAALMRYFKTCDPDDMSQGALSRRVHYLKREKGGIEEMCEYSERIFNGGKEEGLREGRREGNQEGRRERQDEILKMIAGVSRQGSAEDVINEIINKIYGEEKAMTDV